MATAKAEYVEFIKSEKDEIKGKLEKLEQYRNGLTFQALDQLNQHLINRQLKYYRIMIKILDTRLKKLPAFVETATEKVETPQ